MLWCGLGGVSGEGAVRGKPTGTHAARERHERNESPYEKRGVCVTALFTTTCYLLLATCDLLPTDYAVLKPYRTESTVPKQFETSATRCWVLRILCFDADVLENCSWGRANVWGWTTRAVGAWGWTT